jgi:hypothetical protein
METNLILEAIGIQMKSYKCIGGPLDGQEITFEALSNSQYGREYSDYNAASRMRGYMPMVRIHDSLITIPKKAVKLLK